MSDQVAQPDTRTAALAELRRRAEASGDATRMAAITELERRVKRAAAPVASPAPTAAPAAPAATREPEYEEQSYYKNGRWVTERKPKARVPQGGTISSGPAPGGMDFGTKYEMRDGRYVAVPRTTLDYVNPASTTGETFVGNTGKNLAGALTGPVDAASEIRATADEMRAQGASESEIARYGITDALPKLAARGAIAAGTVAFPGTSAVMSTPPVATPIGKGMGAASEWIGERTTPGLGEAIPLALLAGAGAALSRGGKGAAADRALAREKPVPPPEYAPHVEQLPSPKPMVDPRYARPLTLPEPRGFVQEGNGVGFSKPVTAPATAATALDGPTGSAAASTLGAAELSPTNVQRFTSAAKAQEFAQRTYGSIVEVTEPYSGVKMWEVTPEGRTTVRPASPAQSAPKPTAQLTGFDPVPATATPVVPDALAQNLTGAETARLATARLAGVTPEAAMLVDPTAPGTNTIPPRALTRPDASISAASSPGANLARPVGPAPLPNPARAMESVDYTSPSSWVEGRSKGPPPRTPAAGGGGAGAGGGIPPVMSPDAPPPSSGAKLRATLKAQVRPLIESVRRFGQPGVDLFHRLNEWEINVARRVGTALDEEKTIFDSIPRGERKWFAENFGNVVEGREAPRSPQQARAVEWWRNHSKEMRRQIIDSGMRTLDENAPGGFREMGEVDRYYPHSLKPDIREKIRANDPEVVAKYEAANPGKSFHAPDGIKETLSRWHEGSLKGLNPGTELPRDIVHPVEYLDMTRNAMRTYISRANRALAEQEAFRYREPGTGKPRNLDADGVPQGDLGDILARIGKEFDPDAAKEAQTTVLRILGRERLGTLGRLSQEAAGAYGAYNMATKYTGPMTAVVQLTQPAMIFANSPVSAFFGGLKDAVTSPLQSRKMGRQSGAVPLPDEWAHVQGATESGVPGTVAKVSEKAIRIAGAPMRYFDTATRVLATRVADRYARMLPELLNEGGRTSAEHARMLERLRFQPDAIKRFRDGAATAADVDALRQMFAAKTTGVAKVSDRIPLATSSGLGRMLMVGKNFNVAQAQNAFDTAIGEARYGNVKPLAKLTIASIIAGEVMNHTRDALLGPDASFPSYDQIEKKEGKAGLFRRAMADLRAASYFGLLGDVGIKMTTPNATGNVTSADTVGRSMDSSGRQTAVNVFNLYDDLVNSDPKARQTESAWMEFFRKEFRGPAQWARIAEMLSPTEIRKRAASMGGPQYLDVRRQLQDRARSLDNLLPAPR